MSEFVYTTAIKKLRRLSKRKRVIQGGTSAGKTFGILPILIHRAAKEEGLEISVVSESIPHLRRGALKDFIKIMEQTGRYIDSHWNRSLLKYKFTTGSYIEFFSADQHDKLRGARRTDLYVNEANNVDWESFHQMAIRTSDTIWIDFNPVNEFWAHTEVLKDSDSEQLILTYKDNEALSETIVNEIEKARDKAATSDYWANWWKVYGLGEVGALQGVVFSNWEQIDKIPKGATIKAYGLDFGYSNDPTALTAIYYMDGDYYLDEIIYQKELTIGDLSKLMDGRVGKSAYIYADSAEPKSIKELKTRGWRVKASTKGRDSINYGISIMQDQKFYISKRSTNLIDELRRYMWDTDKTGKYQDKPIDAFNHAIDGVRYYFQTSKLKKSRPYGI